MELRQLRYFVRIVKPAVWAAAHLDIGVPRLANRWRAWRTN